MKKKKTPCKRISIMMQSNVIDKLKEMAKDREDLNFCYQSLLKEILREELNLNDKKN